MKVGKNFEERSVKFKIIIYLFQSIIKTNVASYDELSCQQFSWRYELLDYLHLKFICNGDGLCWTSRLLGWADNGMMVQQCTTDSLEQHSSSFEFRVVSDWSLHQSLRAQLPNYFKHSYTTCKIRAFWEPLRVSVSWGRLSDAQLSVKRVETKKQTLTVS